MTDLIALRNKVASILTEGTDSEAISRTMIKMYVDFRIAGKDHNAAVDAVGDNIGAHYPEEEIDDDACGDFDRAVEKYETMTSDEVKAASGRA